MENTVIEGESSSDLCAICPRQCHAKRQCGDVGFCSVPKEMLISKVSLHKWEEPCISGTNGSGTIFFSGCNLRCVFCQNREISRSAKGKITSPHELADIMLELERRGAHNINLVTPTHYLTQIRKALILAKPKLKIPVLYNSGGYDSVESLRLLEGLIDIYMPDFKYFSGELAKKYSHAEDYFEIARAAIAEMYRQVGSVVLREENGVSLMKRGLLIRHLVLPGCRKDSVSVMKELAKLLPKKDFLVSVMRQYTPDFVDKTAYPELSRKLTSFEYDYVMEAVQELALEGFSQSRESACAKYTPDFNL